MMAPFPGKSPSPASRKHAAFLFLHFSFNSVSIRLVLEHRRDSPSRLKLELRSTHGN